MKFITGFKMFKNGRNVTASLGPIAFFSLVIEPVHLNISIAPERLEV